MEKNEAVIHLKAKIHISGKIRAATGLSIGGSGGTLEIGGVDNPIIRNPLNNEPYVPGSSLKGKCRSLLEKFLGKELNNEISKEPNLIRIHTCKDENKYINCPICMIFGSSEPKINKPTRLIVRDSYLVDGIVDGEEIKKKDLEEKGDLPFSELKWETVIDRITAQAMPRELERVPAGAHFKLDLIYDIYEQADIENLCYLFQAMKLLEDDYLGGSGSRGSGKIEFIDLLIDIREDQYYNSGTYKAEFEGINKDAKTVEEILKNFSDIQKQLENIVA